MALTETQEEIYQAIRWLCGGPKPFTTVSEIAEQVSLSKQSVHDNIEQVIEFKGDIECQKVGQANIYYRKSSRFDDIRGQDTEEVARLFNPERPAEYVELRQAPDGSPFDFECHWYDHQAEELEGYEPNEKEMGAAMLGWGSRPVAIKFYDESILKSPEDSSEVKTE